MTISGIFQRYCFMNNMDKYEKGEGTYGHYGIVKDKKDLPPI